MPFTPTHIAAVLPIAWLLRWRVSLSALAIGSMVCDVAVFFPGMFSYWVMHSVTGIFTHCLPMGLAIFFGFHWFIKRPLCALLPNQLGCRLTPWVERMPQVRFQDLILIGVCVVVGAGTHVLWDSFTHYQRWGTNQFPVLNEVAFESSARPVYWYTVLQHGSSVVFLPLMLIGAVVWLIRQPKVEHTHLTQVPAILKVLAGLAIVVVPSVTYAYYRLGYPNASQLLVIHEAVKLAGTIMIVGSLFYGLGYSIFAKTDAGAGYWERNA